MYRVMHIRREDWRGEIYTTSEGELRVEAICGATPWPDYSVESYADLLRETWCRPCLTCKQRRKPRTTDTR